MQGQLSTATLGQTPAIIQNLTESAMDRVYGFSAGAFVASFCSMSVCMRRDTRQSAVTPIQPPAPYLSQLGRPNCNLAFALGRDVMRSPCLASALYIFSYSFNGEKSSNQPPASRARLSSRNVRFAKFISPSDLYREERFPVRKCKCSPLSTPSKPFVWRQRTSLASRQPRDHISVALNFPSQSHRSQVGRTVRNFAQKTTITHCYKDAVARKKVKKSASRRVVGHYLATDVISLLIGSNGSCAASRLASGALKSFGCDESWTNVGLNVEGARPAME